MAEHARISRLSLPRTFGKARFLDYVGLSLGLACGFAIAQLAAASEMDAVRATAVVAIAYGFVASYCHKARFPDTSMEEGGHSALPEAKGLWKKRCRAVSEECGLSERQYEVLVLVAQGRQRQVHRAGAHHLAEHGADAHPQHLPQDRRAFAPGAS